MNDISLPAHVLFELGPISITNSLLTAFVITAVFLLVGIFGTRRFGVVPSRLQVVIELLMEFMLTTAEQSFGSKKQARRFFPMLMTLLLFIAVANQFALIPLVGQLTLGGTSLFRLPTSDLGGTIALSIMVVLIAQGMAIYASPIRYIGNFFRIGPLLKARSLGGVANGFLELFLGILDLIGEIAKVVSLGARLFGNIFAGEVMVAVIAGLSFYTQFIVPIPFIFLSIFSGLVQAFVFALLATQFIGMSVAGVEGEEEEEEEGKALKLEAELATIR